MDKTTTREDLDKSRAEFEAWAAQNGFRTERRNDPTSPDYYFRHETEQRWIVWKAATLARAGLAAPTGQQAEPVAADWINNVVRDIAELPDRDSPPDQPDMMLVTVNELHDIIGRNAPVSAAPAAPSEAGCNECDGAGQYEWNGADEICAHCHGTGKRSDNADNVGDCATCSGMGTFVKSRRNGVREESNCVACSGSGRALAAPTATAEPALLTDSVEWMDVLGAYGANPCTDTAVALTKFADGFVRRAAAPIAPEAGESEKDSVTWGDFERISDDYTEIRGEDGKGTGGVYTLNDHDKWVIYNFAVDLFETAKQDRAAMSAAPAQPKEES